MTYIVYTCHTCRDRDTHADNNIIDSMENTWVYTLSNTSSDNDL